jgi:hypothetical protein
VVDLRELQHDQRHEHAPAAPAVEQAEGEYDAVTRVASSVGNQAFGQLARQGSGILPDGRAHPDVEQAIARTRGSGSSLDGTAQAKLGAGLGDRFHDVTIHHDNAHADELTNAVAARAFTTGSDIYFARGEYRPGTSDGDHLLAHELSHVVQQRGAPTSGPLTVSMPGDELEAQADNAASEALG